MFIIFCVSVAYIAWEIYFFGKYIGKDLTYKEKEIHKIIMFLTFLFFVLVSVGMELSKL